MSPDFFIIGAPKSGTTSLYNYLHQHPQIFMSAVKEPCFFASEVRAHNFARPHRDSPGLDHADLQAYLRGPMAERRFSGVTTSWPDYLRLFDGATGEIAVGEASVCYLWSPSAARNIAGRLPDAKLIAVLRHPVDRAWSQYLHGVATGYVTSSFREHVDASLASDSTEFSPLFPFLQFGNYHQQVKTYLDLFPRQNIRIMFYQDGLASITNQVFRFLNVDPDFQADTSKHHLEASGAERATVIYRGLRKLRLWHRLRGLAPASARPHLRRLAFRKRTLEPMNVEDRRFLCNHYREDVLKLADLLNRDLSEWLI